MFIHHFFLGLKVVMTDTLPSNYCGGGISGVHLHYGLKHLLKSLKILSLYKGISFKLARPTVIPLRSVEKDILKASKWLPNFGSVG